MGTSTKSLLAGINWRRVGQTVRRELHNREIHAPVVSAFRWWARRPHSVMAAVLDAATERFGMGFTVADPFSGGGTVAFEAVHRGLKIYAQDLYPWPTYGLATTLCAVPAEDLKSASDELLSELEPLRALFRRGDGREISHVLRVQAVSCRACDRYYYLFPAPLVSACSRKTTEKSAYFGCAACGTVARRRRGTSIFGCSSCGHKADKASALTGCPHCGETPDEGHLRLARRKWHPILVQEIVHDGVKASLWIRPVEPDDPVDDLPAEGLHAALDAPIPAGVETNRLLSAGFTSWGSLYTRRQATLLLHALNWIENAPYTRPVKDRLALAVLGAAEMPAFVSRWDRANLKPFEGMSNHRYSNSSLVVESNFLSPLGRGTLRRRLLSATKSLAWLKEAANAQPTIARARAGAGSSAHRNWDALVVTGSSDAQALPSASVRLVLTDPPYFDDVQYGELARLFHAWLSAYRPVPRIDESQEAAPNSVRGTTKASYEVAIAACLAESRRTLRADGALVLTFHNRKLDAWRSLANALFKAGFVVRAIAVVRTENGNDHCKRNVRAILHDVVIECVPRTARTGRTRLQFRPVSASEKEMAAIGLALAKTAADGDDARLADRYRRGLRRLGVAARQIS